MPRRNALAVVRHFIEAQRFRQQDRLPPERELAEQLGLTRTQLRTGMKQLESEGIVWRHVGRGTFFGGRPAVSQTETPAPSASNPRELMEARLALEPQLARLAASRATAEDLTRMERHLDRCIGAPDAMTFQRYDADLHFAVAEASHNSLLISLFKSMNAVRHRVLWGSLNGDFLTPDLRKQYDGQHRGFVEAIRRHDGQAAEHLMRFHLEAVEQQLVTVALLFRP
jgi:DNA-binding FadR family transcriptional regulator